MPGTPNISLHCCFVFDQKSAEQHNICRQMFVVDVKGAAYCNICVNN
jgi:hypothetical protein